MVIEKKGFFEVDAQGELNWNDGERFVWKHVTGMALVEGDKEPRPLMKTIMGMFICERLRKTSMNPISQLPEGTIDKGEDGNEEDQVVCEKVDLACVSLACWVLFFFIILLCL